MINFMSIDDSQSGNISILFLKNNEPNLMKLNLSN